MPENHKTDDSLRLTGPFRELIPEYISYKRAQGYKYGEPIVCRLREMDLFFREMGIQEIEITREMYDAWTKCRPSEKESTTQNRQKAIRGFAKYLVSLGYQDVYTGHDDTRIFKRDFIPYVFSREETGRMFEVLDKLCEDSPCYENDTFRIAMLMYYCCGFRRSELLNLHLQDIDLQMGTITIHQGKNDVSRLVPVSDSLLRELQTYQKKHLSMAMRGDHFLYSGKTRGTAGHTVYEKFHWLLTEAGIPPRADGGRQCLHDVRHTFCVRALEQMQEKGFDLYTSLPLLSVYLGHKHITETEYYLRMMEEHFGSILEKTSSYSPDIFPKYESSGGDSENETE